MGAQNSSLHGFLEEEFERLLQKGKKRLVLRQLLQLRLPAGPWKLDPSHLGVLFVLDRYILQLKSCNDVLISSTLPEDSHRQQKSTEASPCLANRTGMTLR